MAKPRKLHSAKIASRQRRSRKTRSHIKVLAEHRLCVHKSNNHIYAQLITPAGNKVIATASTLDKELRGKYKHGGNSEAAALVGDLVAKRCVAAGIKNVAFDRSGYKYHGRVKALADAARKAGLEF